MEATVDIEAEDNCKHCGKPLTDGGIAAYADGPLFCDEGCLDSYYAEDPR